jgi:dolichyl-phosphate beta-glucosyltransferase
MTPPAATATLIIPCYNEEARLDVAALRAMVDGRQGLNLIFVDDGSRDGTRGTLERLAAERPGRISFVALAENGGKAEAVRHGLRAALAGSSDVIGYFDADLSTPPAEIGRLLDIIEERGAAIVMGARVAMLGTEIHRSAARHYLGRAFATVASQALGVRVYDTQCGAKVFRRTAALTAALEAPFLSGWAFDVDLLGRLLTGTDAAPPVGIEEILEVPLRVWRDVPGSKLRPASMLGAAKDLALIGFDLARKQNRIPGLEIARAVGAFFGARGRIRTLP